MAKAKRTTRATSNGAAGSLIGDALGAALAQLSRARAADRLFLPNGIQSLELSFKGPSEFSLKVSGAPGVSAQPLDAQMEDHEDVCLAPDDDEQDFAAVVAAAVVDTQLIVPATGLYGYTSASKRFGLKRVIEAVEAIGETWNALHPDAPIGVGNISKQGGGTLPPHASHKKGIDVDLRPMRKDKKQEPVTFQDSAYSRALTQELVKVVRANTVLGIDRIFFNDPNVTGVAPLTGHHNHLHVRFKVP